MGKILGCEESWFIIQEYKYKIDQAYITPDNPETKIHSEKCRWNFIKNLLAKNDESEMQIVGIKYLLTKFEVQKISFSSLLEENNQIYLGTKIHFESDD